MIAVNGAGSSATRNVWVRNGSRIAAAGLVLSGPVGVVFVLLFAPQPSWQGVEAFRDHYSAYQSIPYAFGLVMLTGWIAIAAGFAASSLKPQAYSAATLSLGVYAVLVTINYLTQLVVVPNLVVHFGRQYADAIALLSMSNPDSICWTIEMWAYAFLGISTWLFAEYYRGRSAATRALLILNGVISLVGAVATVWSIRWVMEPVGLVAFGLWNALVCVALILMDRVESRASH